MPPTLRRPHHAIGTAAAKICTGTKMLAFRTQNDRAHLRRAVIHLERIGDFGKHFCAGADFASRGPDGVMRLPKSAPAQKCLPSAHRTIARTSGVRSYTSSASAISATMSVQILA